VVAAKQAIEAIGIYVETDLLKARRKMILRTRPEPVRYDVRTGAIATMVGLFGVSGTGSTAASASSARKPGTLANRLLESVAVTRVGIRGAGVSLSLLGGSAGVYGSAGALEPNLTTENESSSHGGIRNFQLAFFRPKMDRADEARSASQRATAETAFRADLAQAARELVDVKIGPMLSLGEEAAEELRKTIEAKLEAGFRGTKGFDENRVVTLDLIAILKSIGGDTAKRITALDQMLANVDPKAAESAEVSRDLHETILSLHTTIEMEMEDLITGLQESDRSRATTAEAKALFREEEAFLAKVEAFKARILATRQLSTSNVRKGS
jgi:hypothetical protein